MNAIVKWIVIIFARTVMHILHIFPIKKNRLIFNAYAGTQYSCSPKYLCEYIMKNHPGQFEIIWAFKEPSKFKKLKEKDIKLVKFISLRRLYYESTCSASINNIGSFSWQPQRRGQEHINTWHGFQYKKVGISEIANNELIKKSIELSSKETTLIPLNCSRFEQQIRADLGYCGETVNCGFPRNDILFAQKSGLVDLKGKVLEFFDIKEDTYIVLYAPTWRYDTSLDPAEFDFRSAIKELGRIIGKPVKILSRMHHLTKLNIKKNTFNAHDILDATGYPDMQELLASSDMLITDYSSSIWDYTIMERPILLFATDIEKYTGNRGFHIPIDKWGFPICKNNEELLDEIKLLDTEMAAKRAKQHRTDLGDCEGGIACRVIAERICKNAGL